MTKSVLFALLLASVATTAAAQEVTISPSLPTYAVSATIQNSDALFGWKAELEGDLLLVRGSGILYGYQRVGDTWTEIMPLVGSGNYGLYFAIDGRRVAVSDTGRVETWELDSNDQWRLIEEIRLPAYADLEPRLALSGDVLVVGQPRQVRIEMGAVSIFRLVAGQWIEEQTLTGTNMSYGAYVGLDGNRLSVATEQDGRQQRNGEVATYTRTQDQWVLTATYNDAGAAAEINQVVVDADVTVARWTGTSQGNVAILPEGQTGQKYTHSGQPRDIGLDAHTGVIAEARSTNSVDILTKADGAWTRAGEIIGSVRGFGRQSKVSGDTVAITTNASREVVGGIANVVVGTITILVIDEDGDGVRDGRDACPLDPLNACAAPVSIGASTPGPPSTPAPETPAPAPEVVTPDADAPVVEEVVAPGRLRSRLPGRRGAAGTGRSASQR